MHMAAPVFYVAEGDKHGQLVLTEAMTIILWTYLGTNFKEGIELEGQILEWLL